MCNLSATPRPTAVVVVVAGEEEEEVDVPYQWAFQKRPAVVGVAASYQRPVPRTCFPDSWVVVEVGRVADVGIASWPSMPLDQYYDQPGRRTWMGESLVVDASWTAVMAAAVVAAAALSARLVQAPLVEHRQRVDEVGLPGRVGFGLQANVRRPNHGALLWHLS